ncbi:hypothetical protein EEB11_19225 [Pseudotabrizicola sediminis]|uniref:DUF1127 domain-containing protein n=1 Tax=Pseudotabrizicola sediminis TaxID=2486418 RepID=A0ABY2KGG4_9RHOB|nr:hypothetical protein [Pseudotabrizicola sediminis]TGD41257.1 hypothetical protein EEB11_19225 [Pseudotabrizicola sediminis]
MPVNVTTSIAFLVLPPILDLARVTAWICRRLHLPRIANWLLDRRLLLRTAVSARVEAATLNDLLDVPQRWFG